MVKAGYNDRSHVVDILVDSFDDNKSVNYIIPDGKYKVQRIKRLMEYSFDTCLLFGNVYLSEDKKGCALILLPEKKRITMQSIWLDIKLIFTCIGLFRLRKVLSRETKVKMLQLQVPRYYLWYIGVHQDFQGSGIGTDLLNDVIKLSKIENRTICLETSALKNLPWYKKFGFVVYNELDIGYPLYFLQLPPI